MSENNNVPVTHTVTTPNKKPPTQLDVFRQELTKDYHKEVQNFFSGDKDKALKFMSAVVYSVRKTPALLDCTRDSLFQAFMSCAEFQLYPSNVAGEAYVLPYNSKDGKIAQFQLGYQGIITLLFRAGISVRTQIVYEKDDFKYEEGLETKLTHTFNAMADRGKAVGVYAVATLSNGEKHVKVMSEADVMKFKEFSKAKDTKFSPWNSGNDPELHMWRKTAIKQLQKTLPKTEVVQMAIAKDIEEDSSLPSLQLDAGGPGVGRALHKPDEPVDNNGTEKPADQ